MERLKKIYPLAFQSPPMLSSRKQKLFTILPIQEKVQLITPQVLRQCPPYLWDCVIQTCRSLRPISNVALHWTTCTITTVSFNIVGMPCVFCWESTAHIKVACELRQWKAVLKEKCLSKAQVEQKKIHAWLQENYAVCARWWKKEREAVTSFFLLVLFNLFDIVEALVSIPQESLQNDEFGFQAPVTESEPLNFWSSRYKERSSTHLDR